MLLEKNYINFSKIQTHVVISQKSIDCGKHFTPTVLMPGSD